MRLVKTILKLVAWGILLWAALIIIASSGQAQQCSARGICRTWLQSNRQFQPLPTMFRNPVKERHDPPLVRGATQSRNPKV